MWMYQKRMGLACVALALCLGTQQEVQGSYVRKSVTSSLARRVRSLESKIASVSQGVASAVAARINAMSINTTVRPNLTRKEKPGLLSLNVPPSARTQSQAVTITGSVEDLLKIAIDGLYQGQMTGVHGDTASDVDAIKGDANIDLTKFNLESIVKGDNTAYPTNLDNANLVDLAASSATDLTPRVDALETAVGDTSSGLVKTVNDIKGNVDPTAINLSTINATVGNASGGLVKDVSDIKGTNPGTHSLTSLGNIVTTNNLTTSTNAMGSIGALNTTVGNASGGLVKDVRDLETIIGDGNSGLVQDVRLIKGDFSTADLSNNNLSALSDQMIVNDASIWNEIGSIKGDAGINLAKFNLSTIVRGNNVTSLGAYVYPLNLNNCNLYDIGGASQSPTATIGGIPAMTANATVNAKKLNLLTLNRGNNNGGIGASKRTGTPGTATDTPIPHNSATDTWVQ